MYTVAVVGEESTALTDRLASRLSRSGTVAVVSALPEDPAPGFEGVAAFREAGAAAVVGLGPGGSTIHGPPRNLEEAIDGLAPEHEYCLLDGVADARLPTIVAGEADESATDDGGVDEPLATVSRADRADLDELAAVIEGTEPRETLESLVAEAKRSPRAERSGAVATFTGRVRAKDSEDDARTELLEFEKYEGVAEARMDEICGELAEREGVFEVLMHHRTGVVRDGEDIVFVVVLAGHREEAFRTVEDGINRLKDEVPIFKREVTVDEEFWVHDRE
ncbi:molybdopterin synthase [Halomarina pelagica]|uniref:molybdopterin synthase n=1 Tax=Halomarina pelagica TaxID=2961599 RepID=UPI0020C46EBC|nr:molybdopterin synthase [Halomarina sp. BND7]